MKKFYIAIVLPVLFILGCRKESPVKPIVINLLPPANGVPATATITLNPAQTGFAIAPEFEGLSFETGILTTNTEVLNAGNKVMVQMIKNLGSGVLRIGGGTSDETLWTGAARSATTPPGSLTTSDIDRLSAFSTATGWPVVFGLNLGTFDATTAASEAGYVYNSLGTNLYAIQFGNEPDAYAPYTHHRPSNYNYSNFQQEWETYLAAVKNEVPNSTFAGPDVVFNTDWLVSFAANEGKNVSFVDQHYYQTGPASDPSITYHTLLGYNSKLYYYLQNIKNVTSSLNLNYRVTECNNVYGGGKQGVSDVFASSLWALDFMWQVAAFNGQGINFHDGEGLFYSPIVVDNDVMTASPEYYAMLAFNYASRNATMLPATIDQAQTLSVYACSHTDNTYSVTLVNEDETNDYAITMKLDKGVSAVKIARLTAPALTSPSGVTFAGSQVNTDGTFKPETGETYTVSGTSFVINVPAGSAAVVTMK